MKRKPKLEEYLTAEQKFKNALEARKKKELYQHEYMKRNADKIKQNALKYRENNAELLKQRQREYRQKNAEKISKQKTQDIKCECGKQIKASSISSHKTSIMHLQYLAEKAKIEKKYNFKP